MIDILMTLACSAVVFLLRPLLFILYELVGVAVAWQLQGSGFRV